jgi:hypothetical protein
MAKIYFTPSENAQLHEALFDGLKEEIKNSLRNIVIQEVSTDAQFAVENQERQLIKIFSAYKQMHGLLNKLLDI